MPDVLDPLPDDSARRNSGSDVDLLRLKLVEKSREVTFTGIRQDNDNTFSLVFFTLCKLQSRVNGCSRRDADYKSFGACQLASGAQCVFVFNKDNIINNAGVQDCRNKACTDTLYFMGPWFAAGNNRRIKWFYSDD